jgi:hypothetical protein
MKRTVSVFLLGCSFLWMAPLLKAADLSDSTASSLTSKWYLGLGLGASFPAQNWDPEYTLGGGGSVLVGYRLNPALSLQLSVSPWTFSGDGLTVVDWRVSPELRLANPGPGWAPYVLVGPGYDFQFSSPSGYFTSSLAAVVGVGFQFDFRPGEHAFAEGRYYFLIYNNVTQQDVPVLVGLSEDL